MAGTHERDHGDPFHFAADRMVALPGADINDGFHVHIGGAREERIPAHKPPRNLPPRQETFAGRESELLELHRRLSRGAEVGITQQAAVHGHGGIGKTSLAVEYAWRHLQEYPGGAFFLPCENLLGAPPLHLLAPHLGLTSAETEEEIALRVKTRLEVGEPSLLILDSVVGPQQWRHPVWTQTLPSSACRRLITTRAERLPGLVMYRLDRLTTEDGRRLLTRYRADVEQNQAVVDDVVEWFDGLAVGLTVVGIYMQLEDNLSWEQYVRSLQAKGLGTVRGTEEEVKDVVDYERRVDAVFDDLLEALPPAERRAVKYAALLPEDNVYVPWLEALLEIDGDIDIPKAPGYEGYGAERVVRRLLERQLMRARGEEELVVGLHRVLRRRVREQLREDPLLWERLVHRVGELAEQREQALRGALSNAEIRRELTPLLALVEEVDALVGIRAAASLANCIAKPLQESGRYREGRALLERFVTEERLKALTVVERIGIEAHMAAVLKILGEPGKARQHMDQLIEIAEMHIGTNRPELANCYSHLAAIQHDLGNLAEARRRAEQAIDIAGADHGARAASYCNLAAILRDLGELAEARQRMEQAIEIVEMNIGSNRPELAIINSNLATILGDLGELAEARQRMERAIEIQEQHFEADHPTLATSLNNLGHLELASGRTEQACEMFRRARAILEKHFPPTHPYLQSLSTTIGLVCRDQP